LIDEAMQCLDLILNKIMLDNLKFNKIICDKFENIVSKITKITDNPTQCVDLIKYIENVRYIEIYKLMVN
jgi:hypothetical protein